MPYATNNGVKLHYEVEGQGLPVVLVHGFGGKLQNWRELNYAQKLSQNHRLVLVDVRGHGTSDKPHEISAYDFQTIISDVVTILDELNIEKSGYFGYSMGGRIGLRIPLYAPQRFSSLVIGGSAYPITGKEDSEDDILIFLQQTLENSIKAMPERPMEYYVSTLEKRAGTQMTDVQKADFLANDPWALIACVRAFRSAISPKPDELLPKINIPCMLYVGEADPRFLISKECARRIPGARFVSFSGIDHVQGLTRTDLVLPEVSNFFNK